MSFCPSAGNIEWCYALGALPVIAAAQFGLVAYKILKRPSFIVQIMDTEEFGENQTLIERSLLATNLKVAASLLNAVLCITYIVMFAVIPEQFTFVMPTFMAVQGLNWIGCSWLSRKEYTKQGRSSIALLMSLLFNCVAQSISGAITLLLQDEEEMILNKQELSALVLLETTSILTLILFIVKRTDFTSEALLLQSHLFAAEARQTAITASLLKNDEEIQREKQADYFKINSAVNPTVSPIQDNTTPNNNNNSHLSLSSNQNECSSQATSFLSQQTFTPQGSMTLSRNPSEKIFKADENDKNAIKHVQVIGYKAKNEQMIFVISYKKNGREYRTERSHRDFKYLATLLSEELKETRLSLPQLPKRIKQTAELDKTILNEKKVKYNRFFFYLDFNQIKSKAFDEFLLPVSQKPFFKPAEATLSDAQSSCSENDTCDVSQELNISDNKMFPENRSHRVNSISVVKSSQKTTNQSDNRQRSSTLKVSS